MSPDRGGSTHTDTGTTYHNGSDTREEIILQQQPVPRAPVWHYTYEESPLKLILDRYGLRK